MKRMLFLKMLAIGAISCFLPLIDVKGDNCQIYLVGQCGPRGKKPKCQDGICLGVKDERFKRPTYDSQRFARDYGGAYDKSVYTECMPQGAKAGDPIKCKECLDCIDEALRKGWDGVDDGPQDSPNWHMCPNINEQGQHYDKVFLAYEQLGLKPYYLCLKEKPQTEQPPSTPTTIIKTTTSGNDESYFKGSGGSTQTTLITKIEKVNLYETAVKMKERELEELKKWFQDEMSNKEHHRELTGISPKQLEALLQDQEMIAYLEGIKERLGHLRGEEADAKRKEILTQLNNYIRSKIRLLKLMKISKESLHRIPITQAIARKLGYTSGRIHRLPRLPEARLIYKTEIVTIPTPSSSPQTTQDKGDGNQTSAGITTTQDSSGKSSTTGEEICKIETGGKGGKTGTFRKTLTIDGTRKEYLLYVPDTYKGEPIPLIIVLHCAGCKPEWHFPVWKQVVGNEAILAGPHNWPDARYHWPKGATYWTPPEATVPESEYKSVVGMIEQIGKEYNILRDRIYLTGLSRGATLAYVYGRLYGNIFASVSLYATSIMTTFKQELDKRKAPFLIYENDLDETPCVDLGELERMLRKGGHEVVVCRGAGDCTECSNDKIKASCASARVNPHTFIYGTVVKNWKFFKENKIEDFCKINEGSTKSKQSLISSVTKGEITGKGICKVESGGKGGKTGTFTKTITISGKENKYNVYVPDSYNGGAIPLVIVIYAPSWRLHKAFPLWKDTVGDKAILAGPHPDDFMSNGIEDRGKFLLGIIEELKKEYNISLNKVYLNGHLGATAYIFGRLYGNIFAAVGSHVTLGPPKLEGKPSTRKAPFFIYEDHQDIHGGVSNDKLKKILEDAGHEVLACVGDYGVCICPGSKPPTSGPGQRNSTVCPEAFKPTWEFFQKYSIENFCELQDDKN